MKKISSILLVVMMLCLMSIPISAHEEPEITLQPQNAQFPEYSVASYIVKATGSNLMCTWYIEYEGVVYTASEIGDVFQPWEGYAGEAYGAVQIDSNTFEFFFAGIESGLNGAKIWCGIEDGHYYIESDVAYISVGGSEMPPTITDMPSSITAYQGDAVDIICTAMAPADSQLTYIWYESWSGQLPDIMAISSQEFSNSWSCDTSQVGTRYYVCCVESSYGGRAYSNVVPVTVLEREVVQEESSEAKTPTETVPQESKPAQTEESQESQETSQVEEAESSLVQEESSVAEESSAVEESSETEESLTEESSLVSLEESRLVREDDTDVTSRFQQKLYILLIPFIVVIAAGGGVGITYLIMKKKR